MATNTTENWISDLYGKRQELDNRLKYLKSAAAQYVHKSTAKSRRSERTFRYLELPVALENIMQHLSGPISTTELTDKIVSGRELNERTWVLTNRNVSRLLNNRVKLGRVRKLGRVQGGNRSVLWEWIEN